jgi:hypothetical protein
MEERARLLHDDYEPAAFISRLSAVWRTTELVEECPRSAAGKAAGVDQIRKAAVLAANDDCCLEGRCCSGMEYCCNECDGSCRCSVHGKCNSTRIF